MACAVSVYNNIATSKKIPLPKSLYSLPFIICESKQQTIYTVDQND